MEGLQHFDEQADDGAGRVELAGVLALVRGELAQEVLVHPAQNVQVGVFGGGQVVPRERVDQAADRRRRQLPAGVVLRQHALQRRVLLLDRLHRPVDPGADVRLLAGGLQVLPAVPLRDPEHALGRVLVTIVQHRSLRRLGRHEVLGGLVINETGELVPADLERVRHVLQEDQAQHHVLVDGRIHLAAQLVGRIPQRLLQRTLLRLRGLLARRHQRAAFAWD